jgi:predicted AAA+ superfamily ATPase
MYPMSKVERILKMELPPKQSAFLWGPRKVGKSMWLRENFGGGIRYDFLQTDLFMRLAKAPYLLREELLAVRDKALLDQPVVLDEVQKVPAVLDEVHWLIENQGLRFILCGSSARKLRRGHANLLGGRAWRYEMHPLTWRELPDMDLLSALRNGLMPPHYFSLSPQRTLKAYVEDYLKEEIMAEGLVRNVPSFARFLDAMAFSHGELTNFANIARDCGVTAKTVRAHYEILEDTLLGRFVAPYTSKVGRQSIVAAEKFYLCDVGLAGHLCGRVIPDASGEMFGRAFEHLVIMEIWAHRSYTEKNYDVRFWRTKTGLEVDFVLGCGEVAIEVKGSARVDDKKMRALTAFADDHTPRLSIVVCNETVPRQHGAISILPWREFFARLWAGEII